MHWKNETVSLPIARIDAEDTLHGETLREFLESNGCQVFVNKSPSSDCTYHIIIGGKEFMKKFLVTVHISSDKTFLISWDEDAASFIHKDDRSVKLAIIDAKPLDPQLVGDLFSFFFTSRSKARDFRKEPKQPQAETRRTVAVNEEQPMSRDAREQPELFKPFRKEKPPASQSVDTHRIANTIASIFSKKRYPAPKS